MGGFDELFNNISSSYLKFVNQSIIAIYFYTTEKGKLPHLSYIFFKPEPMGIESNTLDCDFTGILILLEIQGRK